MRLVRLEIHTLPGIEPGFVLENIAPGTNMVTGPNAVGKSSLIRALEYLIGPARSDDPVALSLAAVFESEDGRWTVRRMGRAIVWERDGRQCAPPPLPDRDQLYCYWLSMEDLLQEEERDEILVAELWRELRGGYDLAALREEEPFSVSSRIGQKEARWLKDAEKKLRQIERNYKALRQEEGRIPSLEKDIEAAREAADRAESLRRAIGLLEVHHERLEIEAGLAEFPDNMERLRGDELNRLEKLDNKREKIQGEIEAQLKALGDAKVRLQKTSLDSGRPTHRELETHRSHLEKAKRKADQREEEQKHLERAEAVEKQALNALGGNRAVPQLDPDSVSKAETLATDLQAAKNLHQELSNKLTVLGDVGQAPDVNEVDRLFQAADALREWLVTHAAISRRVRAALLVAGAGGLLATVSAFLVNAWMAVTGGAIGLIGVGWTLFEIHHDGGAAARRRFERTGLEPPEVWQREPVETRLRTIEIKRVKLQARLIDAGQEKEIREELSRTEQELEKLKEQKASLANDLGFDPELTAAALDRFVRLVQDYERAHIDCAAARKAIDRLKQEIDELARQVRDFLAKWRTTLEDNATLVELEAALNDLRDRSNDAEEAERSIQGAERELKRLKRDLSNLNKDEVELFQEAGLQSDQRMELTKRLEQLDAWKEQRERLRNARVLEDERRKSLEGEESLLHRVEANDREGLQRELEQASEEAAKLEGLKTELTTIRTRLEDAGQDLQLEQALSDVATARTALEDRYRAALFSEAANLLLDDVEHDYRNEHEPEVLRNARERFRHFTHYTFELELDEKKEGFMVRDVQQQVRRSLAELSSGTRMQLLLAVRLAWAQHLEQGREILPLFFDEALTTSDESRFQCVAQAIQQMVEEEGRQAFYLSARRSEVILWERSTGTRPHHIDLAKERFHRTDVEEDDFMLPEDEPLPSPEGHTPESYAATLGIPPVNPRQPEGTIHLFHLLRDNLPLLYRLMEQWRISTLGQLENLLQSSAAINAIRNDDLRKRLVERCAAARAWIVAWRRGRSEPVDRIALERSGVVSDKFIDRIAELLRSLSGDGAALVDALRDGRVPRFRSTSADKLEQWLKEEGYINPDEPLTADERLRETLVNTGGRAEPKEIRKVVQWLEAGLEKGGRD